MQWNPVTLTSLCSALLLCVSGCRGIPEHNAGFSAMNQDAFGVRALHLAFRPQVQAPEFYRAVVDRAAELGYTMLILNTGGVYGGSYEVPEPGKLRFKEWDGKQVSQLIDYIRQAGLEPVMEVKAIAKQDPLLRGLSKQHPGLILRLPSRKYGILNPAFRFPDGRDAYDAVQLPMLDNMIALYGDTPPLYLLLGVDEVPVNDLQAAATELGTTVPKLFADLLNRCTAHLLERGITPILWGDMLLSAKLGKPGHGVEGFNHDPRITGGHDTFLAQQADPPSTLTAMNHLANRDKIVVADWHYGPMPNGEYASVDYFQAMGFKDVWGTTWYNEDAIRQFSRYARQRGCGGMIASAWHYSFSERVTHRFPPLLNNSALYFRTPSFQPPAQSVVSFRLSSTQAGDIPADQSGGGAFKLPVGVLSYEAQLDPVVDPVDAWFEIRSEPFSAGADSVRVSPVFDGRAHTLRATVNLPPGYGPAPRAYSLLLRFVDGATGYMFQRYHGHYITVADRMPVQAGPVRPDVLVAADFSTLCAEDFEAGAFLMTGQFRPLAQLIPHKTPSAEHVDGALDCSKAAAWAGVPGLWKRIAVEGMRLRVVCRPSRNFVAKDGYCAAVTMGTYSSGFRLLMNEDRTFLLQFARQDQGVRPIWIRSPVPAVQDGWTSIEVTLSPREEGRKRIATLTVNGGEPIVESLPCVISDANGSPLGLGVEFRPHGGTALARPLFPGWIKSVELLSATDAEGAGGSPARL